MGNRLSRIAEYRAMLLAWKVVALGDGVPAVEDPPGPQAARRRAPNTMAHHPISHADVVRKRKPRRLARSRRQ